MDGDEKAEQLRSSIEQLLPEGITVTASFGIAELHPDGETFEQLLARADQAVYLAKEQGRNCVVQAKSELGIKED